MFTTRAVKDIRPLSDLFPGVQGTERLSGTGAHYGFPIAVTVPLGPPLLVDGVTYVGVIFTSPVDGCRIVSAWASAAVPIGGGTNTFDIDCFDASTNGAQAVITQLDPKTWSTTKEGNELTLTDTVRSLVVDKGDVVNFTLVCGTMTTDGAGLALTMVILLPVPALV